MSRMEAVTTRICLRAVDQYERLLKIQLNKSTKNSRHYHHQQQKVEIESNKTKNESKIMRKNSSSTTQNYKNSFRQWRKKQRENECKTNNINNNEECESTQTCTSKSTSGLASAIQLSNFDLNTMDLSLKLLALNALELTAPASDILLKNRINSWFQLSGHRDVFAPAAPGTIWKRQTGGNENNECKVYEKLSCENSLKEYIPKYYRLVTYNGDAFIELQDLLFGFNDPHVIDIKLGTRTFSECEVSKTTERTDLYKKMVAVDPNAPTKNENLCQAVTKLRYMQFREEQSSTCNHGFRIEAMKLPGAPPITDLKTVKHHQDVLNTMKLFFGKHKNICGKIIQRLKDLRTNVEQSEFFQTHEFIGSSIFMIYDDTNFGVWLIDFAKTFKLPKGQKLTHRIPWQMGNHEEGFLFGLDNLIATLEEISTNL